MLSGRNSEQFLACEGTLFDDGWVPLSVLHHQ